MKLVDAHIHLSDPKYTGHTDELVEDAKNAGVAANVLARRKSEQKPKHRDRSTADRFVALFRNEAPAHIHQPSQTLPGPPYARLLRSRPTCEFQFPAPSGTIQPSYPSLLRPPLGF
jgi:hypothetical protein